MVFEVGPALLAWAALAYKLPALRRTASNPAGRALTGALFWLALSTTFFSPPIYRRIGEATGVANLAVLLAELCGIIMIWPARNLLLYQDRDWDRARRRARGRYRVLPALLVLAVAFWAQAGGDTNDPRYVFDRAADPFAVAFMTLHHLVLVGAGIDAMAFCWRLSSGKEGGLRVGLRAVAAAGGGALVMVGYDLSYFAASLLHRSTAAWGDVPLLMALMLHTSTSLFAIGATLPDLVPRVVRLAKAGWALHQLHPLWRDLAAAEPAVVLPRAHAVHHLERRLHRRVTEIRDAQLALHGYRPPASASPAVVLAESASIDSKAWAAFVEAASIAGAVRAKARGLPAQEGEPALRPAVGGADLDSEVAWLVEIARHYPAARQLAAASS